MEGPELGPETASVSTKGYLEQMTLEETVKSSRFGTSPRGTTSLCVCVVQDTRELIPSSDSDSDTSENQTPAGPSSVRRRSTKKKRAPPKW